MTPAQNSQNTPEHDLSRTLARQADRYVENGGTGLELDRVLSRAGEIRRGRRMRASMVMAAVVLAVAVPVGISALGNDPTVRPPVGPAGTPTAKTTDVSPLSLDGLRVGGAPAHGYLYAGTLHGPEGEQPLGKGGEPVQVARINGGFLVQRSALDVSNPDTASFIADDGSRASTSWPVGAGGFAVSPDRNVGAFVEPDGTVLAVQDGGSRFFEIGTVPVPDAASVTAVAVTGENCSGRSEEIGCTVYVTSTGENPQTWSISPNTPGRVVSNGQQRVVAVSADGLVAGYTSVTDDGSCSSVTDGSDKVWNTCDHSLSAFSPSGKLLLAGPAYKSGAGDSELAVLDAVTGEPRLQLSASPDVIITAVTWEDDEHLIVNLLDGDAKAALVRVALDGSRELASPVVRPVDAYVSPYNLG
ncbi:MAG: hypothetical protein JWQ74_1747 [Marmoricola sp.]|nr:hypothetical protein [Marmoricola sp.]